MPSQSRKQRGRESEALVAKYLQPVFPYAERVPASLPGKDILHTPGWALEVKARRGLDLPGWLKQANGRALLHLEVPVLVVRPDGFGPERINQWAAVVTLEEMRKLMRGASEG